MKLFIYCLLVFGFISCVNVSSLSKYAKHYRKHQDYNSLNKALELIALQTDTAQVAKLLGKPIDMGFDYRYLIDSTGPNGCVVGAVFHIDENGKIDQKWLGEICE